jgi:hypothetical protein
MRSTRRLTIGLALAAVLGVAAGCSGGPGLFDDSCNTCAPTPVAQGPCDPPPVCEPPPVACPPPTDPVVQAQRPPDAAPGEVWCYVRVPAETRTESEQVCVRPAGCREVQVPAKTQQVERQVCVRPASVRTIPIPAEYQTVEERVCVAPGRTEWQRVDCNPSKLGPNEQVGECWTLREVPPQYQTNARQVCVRPESCRQEEIPAEYTTQLETVVIEPARVEQIPIPAEYETRLREVVVRGPRWEWRRTTECEVPAVAGGGGMGVMQPLPDAGYGAPTRGYGSPDDDALPPAGDLPPLGR